MRLFIAIRFSEAILEALWYIENQLCQQALSGNFTRKENFHLTLSFLGDVTEVDAILQVMDQVKLPAFPLRLEGIGCLCQEKGGDILWAGVRESQGLRQLQSFLERALRLKGFPLEQRGFQPHITLGRKVKLCEGFPLAAFSATIPPVDMEVRKFYLMRSDSPQGILTYTEIYERELEGLPGHSYDSDE